MAQLLPQGRFLTISLSASSAVLYCEEINFETSSTAFTRNEFNKDTLKQAPESTGATPTLATTLTGLPAQFIYGSATTARDLTPNNFTNLANMEQKLFYNRYTITGDVSLSSDTGLVFNWAALHRTLQDRYDAHLKYSGDGLSYQDFLTQQAVTFSYLTTTGLTISGSTLGSLSNCLIRSFSVNPVRDIQGLPSGAKVLYRYSLVADQISIRSAAAT